MSDANRALEALTHAIEAQANGGLALIDELTQSRIIQQEIATSNAQIAGLLGQMLDGQARMEAEMHGFGKRQTEHEGRQSQSEGRLRVVESKLVSLEHEIKSLSQASRKGT